MTDIVERLRQWGQRLPKQNCADSLEAAAEIERLRTELAVALQCAVSDEDERREIEQTEEIERLRAALKPFARMATSYPDHRGGHVVAVKGATIIQVSDLKQARAALEEKE